MSKHLPLSHLATQSRLLQLASQALPTGAFAYSGGLETALAVGWITGEADGSAFVSSLFEGSVGHLELPLFLRMYDAFCNGDLPTAEKASRYLLASRESAEFQAQDGQMARALFRVLQALCPAVCVSGWHPLTFAESLAAAAHHYQLPREDSALLCAYTWIEQHTTALARLLPLGPIASQRVLSTLLLQIPPVIERALTLPEDALGFGCPGLALASALHETQYSRIFRS